MKININIVIICTIVNLLSILGLCIVELFSFSYIIHTILQNIIIGIFSSSIISIIISLAAYFHERYHIYNKIFSNAKDLYINLFFLSYVINNNIQKLNFTDISNLEFRYIGELSDLNIKLIQNMDLEIFWLFYKYEKLRGCPS